jgi:TRAP-type transport system periplasmic protein
VGKIAMKAYHIDRRSLLAGMAAAPAIIGAARAAPMTLKLSSSLPNDPKFANGRVYYDNLVRRLAAHGLADRLQVQFFPDNQLGQEIDVVSSVSLGVIDLMVTGTSIWANVAPLIGLLDLGYLFESFPQQTRALDAGAAKPLEQALKNANVQIIGWAYNFGSRSVLCKSAVNGPADLAGKRIRTLPNKIITECLKLMGAAATPLAFGEIYTALQAGVLDGLEHDPPTVVASKFSETAKFYALTQHNFSALGTFCSAITLSRMDPTLRDQFLAAASEAAVDTRARGLEAEKEALATLKQKGVDVIACDREPFRKLTLPQTDAFIKAHPDAKPIIDIIRNTKA